MRSIVSRMILSYITNVNRYEWPGVNYSQTYDMIDICLLETIYKDLEQVATDHDWMSLLLQWIADKEKEEGKDLWIHFTLDEYNQVIRSLHSNSNYQTIFDDWIEKLALVKYKLKRCKFTNLLSGTHMQDLNNLKSEALGGPVYLKRIELLNFSQNEQDEIYSNEQYPLSIAYKTLFESLGGHARLIEIFGTCVKGKNCGRHFKILVRENGTGPG